MVVFPVENSVISIHALREEGDDCYRLCIFQRRRFLSTPSARRATNLSLGSCSASAISIHALREEGDDTCCHAVYLI